MFSTQKADNIAGFTDIFFVFKRLAQLRGGIALNDERYSYSQTKEKVEIDVTSFFGNRLI